MVPCAAMAGRTVQLRVGGQTYRVVTSASDEELQRLCQGRAVLLVEDDAVNRIVTSELIRAVADLVVDAAEDGATAVEMAASKPDDLILMDMQLPGIDGLEATRQIHALPGCAGLPIVALTANVLAEDVTRCIDAGMVGHLGKPVVAEELRQLFRQRFGG